VNVFNNFRRFLIARVSIRNWAKYARILRGTVERPVAGVAASGTALKSTLPQPRGQRKCEPLRTCFKPQSRFEAEGVTESAHRRSCIRHGKSERLRGAFKDRVFKEHSALIKRADDFSSSRPDCRIAAHVSPVRRYRIGTGLGGLASKRPSGIDAAFSSESEEIGFVIVPSWDSLLRTSRTSASARTCPFEP
jgi:hypothetical protein